MGIGLTAHAMHKVTRVFRDGTLVGMSDCQVLERFVESQDETAFEAILTRHGPMVRRVCQQILFDRHDVDDAVQAVFLVLVRKARIIRVEGSLGPWLYTVAGRVAARARANRRKRLARESFKDNAPEPSYSSTAGASEIPVIIHDELCRLPEGLRAPLVLCYLEGLTHDSAARQLHCPVGTVRSRLARARDLLHRRITRRGLTLAAAALGGALESGAGAAVSTHLPASLVRSITAAAVESVRSNGMGLSTSFAMILEGVLNVLPIKKVAVLATAISMGTIAFAVVERTTVGQTPEPKSQAGQSVDGPRPQELAGERITVLPRLETKKDPHVVAIEARLKEKVSVAFDKKPLGEAIAFLQNCSGVNIVLDPKALREEGLTPSSPVSVTANQVPIRSVLKQMLRPLCLTYTIVNEVVLITNPHADGLDGRLVGSAPLNDGTERYPKTYYVGDLVQLDRTRGQRSVTVGSTAEFPKVNMTPLMDVIAVSVAPGTWNIQDGYGHEVPTKTKGRAVGPQDQLNAMVPYFVAVSLIVKCPAEQHDEIAHILRCLRRLKDSWDDTSEDAERPFQPSPAPTDHRATVMPVTSAEAVQPTTIDQPKTEQNEWLDEAGGLKAKDGERTGVAGVPDVDVTVLEWTRAISPQQTTTFEIRLANYGTGEATNLKLAADLSTNLEFQALERGPNGVNVAINETKDIITFERINKLEPRKVMVFGIKVKAVGQKSNLATCKVTITHDGLTEPIQDMAGVKVTTRPAQKVAQKRESAKTPN
jgi:RNA polymerase sigma factor (sigma-70 family)